MALFDNLNCESTGVGKSDRFMDWKRIIVQVDQASLKFCLMLFFSSTSFWSSSFIFLIIWAPTSFDMMIAGLRLLLRTLTCCLSSPLSNKENQFSIAQIIIILTFPTLNASFHVLLFPQFSANLVLPTGRNMVFFFISVFIRIIGIKFSAWSDEKPNGKAEQKYLPYNYSHEFCSKDRINYDLYQQIIAIYIFILRNLTPMKEEQIPGSQPSKKVKLDNTELQQLKKHSLVVADTGEFNLIQKYKPEDSTTNPTLILQASQKPEFQSLIKKSVQFGINNYQVYLVKGKKKKEPKPVVWSELDDQEKSHLVDLIYDHLSVSFGCQILKIVPGYVSTEVDAKLSFDKKASVDRAKRIIQLYKNEGADTSKILIKLASTWEGIMAGEALKKDKIKCNMTLVFHKVQAIACGDRQLFLISPFVGRILDWFKKETGKNYENPADDPGVLSVTEIFNYYKKFDYKTIVMGASFRTVGQIKELCGCDRLTISPKLLEELSSGSGEVPQKLDSKKAQDLDIEPIEINEATFRYEMNKSKMATDLLSAGIRKFQEDGDKLKSIIIKCINQLPKVEGAQNKGK